MSGSTQASQGRCVTCDVTLSLSLPTGVIPRRQASAQSRFSDPPTLADRCDEGQRMCARRPILVVAPARTQAPVRTRALSSPSSPEPQHTRWLAGCCTLLYHETTRMSRKVAPRGKANGRSACPAVFVPTASKR
jgi:hypothetical protein